LNEAEFREFRDKRQALSSVGWAGQNPSNPGSQWLFGVCASLRRVPLIGRSIMDHELFHGVQEVQSGSRLFRPPRPLRWWQWAFIEVEAYVFGSPLIGLPILLLLVLSLAFFSLVAWVVLDALPRLL
jgi:hypothetical protein